jgi:hypothetical protein
MLDISEKTKLTNLGSFLYDKLETQPVIKPVQHGQFGVGTVVSISHLLAKYPYKPLENFCNDFGSNGHITLKYLLTFFDEYVHDETKKKYRGNAISKANSLSFDVVKANHSDNTVGRYPLVMEVVFAIYGIKCIEKDGMYYDINLTPLRMACEQSYHRIRPKRVAFTMLYLLRLNIVRKYGKYVDIEYEVSFDNNSKKYDAALVFKKEILYPWMQQSGDLYDGFAEINESAHTEGNSNDVMKRMIVGAHGKVISYYVTRQERDDMPSFRSTNEDHSHIFIRDMMQVCKDLLICYSDVFKVDNLFEEAKVIAGVRTKEYEDLLHELSARSAKDAVEREQLKLEIEHKQDEMELWNDVVSEVSSNVDVIAKLYHFHKIGYRILRDTNIKHGGHIIDMGFIVDRLGVKIDKASLGLSYMMTPEGRFDKPADMVETERHLIKFGVRRKVSDVEASLSRYPDVAIKYSHDSEWPYFYDFNGMSSLIQDINMDKIKQVAQVNHRILLTVLDIMDVYTHTMAKYGHAREEKREENFAKMQALLKKEYDRDIMLNKEKHAVEKKLLEEHIKQRDHMLKKAFTNMSECTKHLSDIDRHKAVFNDMYGTAHEIVFKDVQMTVSNALETLDDYVQSTTTRKCIVEDYDTIYHQVMTNLDYLLVCDPLRIIPTKTKTVVEGKFKAMKKNDKVFQKREVLKSSLKDIHLVLGAIKDAYQKRDNAWQSVAKSLGTLAVACGHVDALLSDAHMQEFVGIKTIQDLSVTYEENASIVKGIPHLALHYVCDIDTHVDTETAISIIMSHNINKTKATKIIKEFYEVTRARKWDDPHILVYLKDVRQAAMPAAVPMPEVALELNKAVADNDSDCESYQSDSD